VRSWLAGLRDGAQLTAARRTRPGPIHNWLIPPYATLVIEGTPPKQLKRRALYIVQEDQYLHGIRGSLVSDIVGSFDRLCCADRSAAQQVQHAVVGDPEQPGTERRDSAQPVQGDEGPGKGVLHDVLAVYHRSHETRTITVELRPQLSDQGEELRPSGAVRRVFAFGQAVAPSITVTPASPLRPKTTPSAYCGSSSTETTLSPNARGGIGAPKRATNCSGVMPMEPA
jgi:hypothetical protein